MSKSNRRRRRKTAAGGWSTSLNARGCFQISVGLLVCGGAFVNLIITQEGEDEFFRKARPVKPGMSREQVVELLGEPDQSQSRERYWGDRAPFKTSGSPPYEIEVPIGKRGTRLTEQLTWRYGRYSRLDVYLVDDEVIATGRYTRRSKQ